MRIASTILTAALFGVAAMSSSPARAQVDERCYPGSPVRILRELMGGVDTEDNYLAAVTRYVRSACRPGQILKLISPAGLRDRNDRLNQQLALSLCDHETIDREPLGMGGESALVLHCVIAPQETTPSQ